MPAPYVMLFLFTLHIQHFADDLPLAEVSKKLAVGLYFMFLVLGLIAA